MAADQMLWVAGVAFFSALMLGFLAWTEIRFRHGMENDGEWGEPDDPCL
ncbi:MAG: hypothetical protein AB1816_16510 [Bacillota bacterium]